jgi:chromosome segregation ATPase
LQSELRTWYEKLSEALQAAETDFRDLEEQRSRFVAETAAGSTKVRKLEAYVEAANAKRAELDAWVAANSARVSLRVPT